jgi:hypothetical protein
MRMAAASDPPPPRGFHKIACCVRSKNRSLTNSDHRLDHHDRQRRPSFCTNRWSRPAASARRSAARASGHPPAGPADRSRWARPSPTFSSNDDDVVSTRSPSSLPRPLPLVMLPDRAADGGAVPSAAPPPLWARCLRLFAMVSPPAGCVPLCAPIVPMIRDIHLGVGAPTTNMDGAGPTHHEEDNHEAHCRRRRIPAGA